MKNLVFILMLLSVLSGCASIVDGKNQNINIVTSNGKTVEATIFTKAGVQETTLPRMVSVVKDSQNITIRVKEDKCNEETVTVAESHIAPWFWGNILIGGILGSTTDSNTGAMWQYDDSVIVNVNDKAICSK